MSRVDRWLFAFAAALLLACGVDTTGDAPLAPAAGGAGACTPAAACNGCGSCFESCVCFSGDAPMCKTACAASGGTGAGANGAGGANAGGGAANTSGTGAGGSGGASTGGSGGASTGGFGAGATGGASSGGQGAGGASGSGGANTGGGGGAGGFAPGAVTWFDFPEQHTQSSAGWSTYMTDVIRHLPLSYGNYYYDADKVTHVHETTHGIHSHLRNYFNTTGKKANAFYVGGSKAALVVEPKIMKSDANPFVPQSLREFRYQTYLAGATDWNDTPLYLFDEWVAYTNGTEAGVTLVNEGKWNAGWRDSFGSLEFTVYAFALAMAVEAKDPTYFTGYPQFREFLKWNSERAMALYQKCRVMPEFKWDKMDGYYAKLGSNADAAELRAFAKKTFGAAWTQQVLGF